MKKKLLFVIDSLCLGGAEKSLVNLLHSLDYSKFEVHLFLLHKKGIFMELLPQQVRVLEHAKEWTFFQQPLLRSLTSLFLSFRFDVMYHRVAVSYKSKFTKLSQPDQQRLWGHFTSAIPEIKGEYDTAIGYLEKYSNYFIVDKVKAKRKIGWVHIDYKTYGLDCGFDAPYFEHLDYIVGVSDSCVDTLNKCFPNIKARLINIENISSPNLIYKMSKDKIPLDKNGILIVTAARLVEQKGIHLTIEAASLLHKRGNKFKWIILGDGPLKAKLQKMIEDRDLEMYVELAGAVANPYPYIKNADIYVQTSLFEGKSISIDEAKILCKPIVATKFPTVHDQLKDGYSAILAEINALSIYEKIKYLIDKPEVRSRLEKNLLKENVDNESKIQKFYSIIA